MKNDFEENLIFDTKEKSEEDFAKEIMEYINNKENKVNFMYKHEKIQSDLDKVYDNFSDNYIKPLRRKLPGI